MMELSLKAYTELFHLIFLRQFSAQISPALYAIKGGCNLRFFFNSIRYSEDLDLDIRTIATETLRHKVNNLLSSSPLLKLLESCGITLLEVSAPKQTQTVQRWKIQLQSENTEMPYHTKIEFSRRSERIDAELANVSMKICQAYHLSPTRLSHYGLKEAIAQKILALAHRSSTQARDVFDLYHLLHFGTPALSYSFQKTTLAQAEAALLSIHFNDYRSQVVIFLEPKEQFIYDNEQYWITISNEVFRYLNGLSR